MPERETLLLRLRSQPYLLLVLMALILFLVSMISNNSALDFTYRDKYFVIAHDNICLVMAGIFLLMALLYFICGRVLLSKALTWIHVLLSFLAMSLLLILQLQFFGMEGIPRRYYAITAVDAIRPLYVWITGCAIVFVIGQLILIFNLFAGLVKYFFKLSRK
jgi:heme/copper-type cytochrome/quinol oxidase subunit 1